MRIIVISILVLFGCNAGKQPGSKTPVWKATVQQRMPGNVIAEDGPGSEQPSNHFDRRVYILMPETVSLKIDSIIFKDQSISYTHEKLPATDKSFIAGKSMKDNVMIDLKPVKGREWWMISIGEDNQELTASPFLIMPLKIYTHSNGIPEIITVKRETTLAPQERY